MSPIHTISIAAEHLPFAAQEFVYVIAGVEVVFSREVPVLRAFFVGSRLLASTPINFNQVKPDDFELNYHGSAPFANALRDVKFYRHALFAQINIDDAVACQVSLEDNHIHVLNGAAFDSEINLELLTGPALLLLLAQLNVFCLHAGSIATPFGNVAIIAESGAGKSTLSSHVGDDWSQLSDDILPLKGKKLLPNFPQLKLPNAVSEGRFGLDDSLRVIFRVNPIPCGDIQFRRLSTVEAMLQVVRHTVAAKLFNRDLLSEHASFANELVSSVSVIELSYPRDLSRLGELRAAILSHLSDL